MKNPFYSNYKRLVFGYIPFPWAILCTILLTTDGITWFGHLGIFICSYFVGIILALVIYNAYDFIRSCIVGFKTKK